MMSHPVLHEAFTLIVTLIRSLLYTYTVCVNFILYDVCVNCILYVLTVRENRRGGIASVIVRLRKIIVTMPIAILNHFVFLRMGSTWYLPKLPN